MNEQSHTNCSILQKKLPRVLPVSIISSISSAKVNEPGLFEQIIQRYTIGTRQGNFPLLIFLRLLETVGGTSKLTNVNQSVMQKILNPTIIQYLNLHATGWPAQNANVYDSHHDPHFENRFSSGKRQFVTPRFMRHLQLVNEQSLSHIFESSETKTQETVELVGKLPERTISLRERMKNPLILPNNLNTKSNFLSSSVVKTQSYGMQLEKADDLLKLQHATTPDVSSFDEYTNPVVAEARVDENTKAKDIILHSSTHTNEDVLKTDTMVARVQKRNRLVYEKHEDFRRRTADRYLMPEKKNIANRLVSNTHIARLGIEDMEAEDGEVMTSPDLLSEQDGISLHHADHVQTDVSVPFDFTSSNIARRASDLVLRKDSLQKSDEEPENSVKSDTITTGISKTDAEKEAVAEKNVKSLNSVENIDDITIIADRVYKLLESKISIEKERRGLR
jgi:hypothetical protein